MSEGDQDREEFELAVARALSSLLVKHLVKLGVALLSLVAAGFLYFYSALPGTVADRIQPEVEREVRTALLGEGSQIQEFSSGAISELLASSLEAANRLGELEEKTRAEFSNFEARREAIDDLEVRIRVDLEGRISALENQLKGLENVDSQEVLALARQLAAYESLQEVLDEIETAIAVCKSTEKEMEMLRRFSVVRRAEDYGSLLDYSGGGGKPTLLEPRNGSQ